MTYCPCSDLYTTFCPCLTVPVRDPSQTSTGVDALPDASLVESSAQIPAVPTDLAASAPDRAADVAGTTGGAT